MKISNKVLVIDGAMVSRSPHVAMYLHLLNKGGVDYDVAVWNRKGDKTDDIPSNYMVYNKITEDYYPAWRKLLEIYKFYRFVKNKIKNTKYNSIIIFEIANSLYFYKYLKTNYYRRYIFDIRDYSPFCKFDIANKLIKKMVSNSYATMISSEGFKSWLPEGEKYVISHNISDEIFNRYRNVRYKPFSDTIRILTIGNLRDPYINSQITGIFGNNSRYYLKFVGDGAAQPIISSYCKQHNIQNVSFYGHYQKSEEANFYMEADIINCCMEDNMLSNYLMSNRIYLSALFRKPIICNRGSYQTEIIEKYGIGVAVDDVNELKGKLEDYIKSFNATRFEENCNVFLKDVEKEQRQYEKVLFNLINSYDE